MAVEARPVAYVTAETLAALLDCSKRTITEYKRQGILPRSKKIGTLTRWDWREVEARINAKVEARDPILEASRGR